MDVLVEVWFEVAENGALGFDGGVGRTVEGYWLSIAGSFHMENTYIIADSLGEEKSSSFFMDKVLSRIWPFLCPN